MEELFIQIDENGQAKEHPIMGDNFRQAFPNIDTNNLPSNFARFERIPPPLPSVYQTNHRVTYKKRHDGVWIDVHSYDFMTREEITALQDQVKANFAASNGPASWTFNEFTCQFDPPIRYPNDGKNYRWDEPTINWVEITA